MKIGLELLKIGGAHPQLIDKEILRKMTTYNDGNKTPIEYILGNI